MIIVDSSVWIDYFNGKISPHTNKLDELLGQEVLAIGELILSEVLRGFRQDADYHTAKQLMLSLTVFDMVGMELAIRSAENYRLLRKKGLTVRKMADVMIATFCIEHQHALLFADKDFLPFVEHLKLKTIQINH